MRLLLVAAVLFGIGATLVLSEMRWFTRQPLTDRLRPYVAGGAAGIGHGAGAGVLSVESLREVIAPLVTTVGAALTRALGVHEDVATRLRRIHSPVDATTFRLRQAGWCAATSAGALAVLVLTRPPAPFVGLVLVGTPALAFLVIEQQLMAETERRQQQLISELPVVAEQLGLLLGAGYSLGGAVARLAQRNRGVAGPDLRRVVARTRQGLDDVTALREWAQIAGVEPVHRLVGVLALNRDAGDLDRLIGEEARAIRRDVHRTLIERIERRSQQVWIPVTVAALVPGAIFIAIPFIHALRAFGTT